MLLPRSEVAEPQYYFLPHTIAFHKCPPLLGRNQWIPMLSTATKSDMAHMRA